MKYTEEQCLDIGRQIYNGEISTRHAVEKFGISYWTAKFDDKEKNKTVYYNLKTGAMLKGKAMIDGKQYEFHAGTGALIGTK